MALRTLLLNKKLNELRSQLTELTNTAAGFAAREADLMTAIEEAQTEEERSAVEEAVTAFETDQTNNTQEQETLRTAISELEEQIRTAEEAAKQARSAPPVTQQSRKDDNMNNIDRRAFFGMNIQERDAFLAREDIKNFLERVREMAQEKRSVSGAELMVPTVALELIRSNIAAHSRLIQYVNLKPVKGKARQPIAGTVPEAVWTEATGSFNELNMTFAICEVDAYKVGGFIPIPNSVLDDNVALATEAFTGLGQAIGIAVDKAILYGTGKKMPLGIVTRLVQPSDPGGHPKGARPWADLHTSNVLQITGKDDLTLFKEIVKASGAAKSTYSASGKKFWALSDATLTRLQAASLGINAAGAIVAGVNQQMPVLGGDIVPLPFIPDDIIIGGYGDLYMLAEREGTHVAVSEHARFIQDQTVFAGGARYDGEPAVAEGFVAIGIGKMPNATMAFAEDAAAAASDKAG